MGRRHGAGTVTTLRSRRHVCSLGWKIMGRGNRPGEGQPSRLRGASKLSSLTNVTVGCPRAVCRNRMCRLGALLSLRRKWSADSCYSCQLAPEVVVLALSTLLLLGGGGGDAHPGLDGAANSVGCWATRTSRSWQAQDSTTGVSQLVTRIEIAVCTDSRVLRCVRNGCCCR